MRFPALVSFVILCATAAGVVSTMGRLGAATSGSGCLNQDVSNEMWRAKVTGFSRAHRNSPWADAPSTGWQVSLSWTNSSGKAAKTIKADDGKGVVTEGRPNDWELYFASGKPLGINDYDASRELSKAGTGILGPGEDQTKTSDFFDRTFPPGVERQGHVFFWYPAKNPAYQGKPVKMVLDWETYVHPHYSTLRFNFDCTK